MDRDPALAPPPPPASHWLTTVSGDAHFWVPTLVLLGGLLLLRWVS
jgi:hypothetical protein